jgi:hypothetical protein
MPISFAAGGCERLAGVTKRQLAERVIEAVTKRGR